MQIILEEIGSFLNIPPRAFTNNSWFATVLFLGDIQYSNSDVNRLEITVIQNRSLYSNSNDILIKFEFWCHILSISNLHSADSFNICFISEAIDCKTMFKVLREHRLWEDTRGRHTTSNRWKSAFAVLGGIYGLPCPWRESSFCVDVARFDFYRASEIILQPQTVFPERASHGICTISPGRSTARAYFTGLFQQPELHWLLGGVRTEVLW